MAKKILIIDDDQDYVEATTTLLETKGYAVISANEGKTGFQKASFEKPDLILLDVMMTTNTEGFDVSRYIQSDPGLKFIPVIIITGIRKEMDLPYSFKPDENFLPVKKVMEKPVKPAELLKAIQEIL